jgi:hypothetical protein
MALGSYTLLDLALRSGKNVHSLVEGVITYAPELAVLPTFPRAGLTYSVLTRTGLPAGGFRNVGEGVTLSKSEFKREVGSMYLFECQMKVGQDVVIAAQAEQPDLAVGDVLADEALANMRGSIITIGSQFYYGTKVSTKGFAGLSQQVAAGNILDAGGSAGGDTTSVYLVYMDDTPTNPQGVHFLLGSGGRMTFSDQWIQQQFAISGSGTSTTYAMGFVNNFLSYLGLVSARKEAVYQIKNVDATHAVTDALIAQLISLIPAALIADKSKWRLFMNPVAAYTLQKSRSAVTTQNTDEKGQGGFSPDPVASNGIMIQKTESLVNTERAGLHQ